MIFSQIPRLADYLWLKGSSTPVKDSRSTRDLHIAFSLPIKKKSQEGRVSL